MDVLKEIEAQVNSIKKVDSSAYLDSIFLHIERAEFYYKSGINDSNFFNDVIYRSNQAYEGALKESYKVLAEKGTDEVARTTPNDIEKFFETENIFKGRVLQLFKNYRQEWRNKSTHDYKLFFDESEAFIALSSVTSFVHLLLKHIQEKAVYISQQKKLELEPVIDKVPEAGPIASDLEVLAFIVSNFAQDFGKDLENMNGLREVEIMGALHAYLEHNASGMYQVYREARLGEGSRMFIADFIVAFSSEKIILELKAYKASRYKVEVGLNQILQYLESSGLTKGILYYANERKNDKMPPITKVERTINDLMCEIIIIGA